MAHLDTPHPIHHRASYAANALLATSGRYENMRDANPSPIAMPVSLAALLGQPVGHGQDAGGTYFGCPSSIADVLAVVRFLARHRLPWVEFVALRRAVVTTGTHGTFGRSHAIAVPPEELRAAKRYGGRRKPCTCEWAEDVDASA